MGETANEFIALLMEAQVLRFGEFTLKSGKKSDFFVDFGRISKGSHLRRLGACFASSIVQNGLQECDVIFGPSYKGIPIALATSMSLEVDHGVEMPFSFNRKLVKNYGEKRNFLGTDLKEHESVLVVDDVITDGGTKYEVIEMLKQFPHLEVAAFIVGVDREERNVDGVLHSTLFAQETGVRLLSLTRKRDIVAVRSRE